MEEAGQIGNSQLSYSFQGERLSHAVGCAFAICLEKKQERDRLNVTMSFNKDDSTFTRFGSFRQGTITERLQVSQSINQQDHETC